MLVDQKYVDLTCLNIYNDKLQDFKINFKKILRQNLVNAVSLVRTLGDSKKSRLNASFFNSLADSKEEYFV